MLECLLLERQKCHGCQGVIKVSQRHKLAQRGVVGLGRLVCAGRSFTGWPMARAHLLALGHRERGLHRHLTRIPQDGKDTGTGRAQRWPTGASWKLIRSAILLRQLGCSLATALLRQSAAVAQADSHACRVCGALVLVLSFRQLGPGLVRRLIITVVGSHRRQLLVGRLGGKEEMNSTFGTSKPQVLTRTTSDNVLDRRGGRIHGTATRGTRKGRTYRVSLLLGWEASDSCTAPAYQSAAWPIFSSLELRSTKNNARFTSLLALAGTHVENPSTAAVAAPSITVKAPKDDTHQMKASARGGGILLIPPRAS